MTSGAPPTSVDDIRPQTRSGDRRLTDRRGSPFCAFTLARCNARRPYCRSLTLCLLPVAPERLFDHPAGTSDRPRWRPPSQTFPACCDESRPDANPAFVPVA